MDKNEFSATFPDQVSLNTFSKLTTVGLALYGYEVKISKTNVDPDASSVLQSTWIRIGGVPSFARKVDVIKEITFLVAEPIKVDEISLLRDEPVRVRVNFRNPANLKALWRFSLMEWVMKSSSGLKVPQILRESEMLHRALEIQMIEMMGLISGMRTTRSIGKWTKLRRPIGIWTRTWRLVKGSRRMIAWRI